MKRIRACLWALSIGVLATLLASVLVRVLLLPLPMLLLSVAIAAAAISLIAEISPAIGACGGAVAALLVAAVLGFTLAAAPLGPRAHHPQLRDLLWKPLFLVLVVAASCASAGWLSSRAALAAAHRLRRNPKSDRSQSD
jgi:hypothetical protein